MSVVDHPDQTQTVAAPPPAHEPRDTPRAPQRMRMIAPPPRGDGPARLYLLAGAGFYVAFSLLFTVALLSHRPDKGRALAELFGVSAEGVNWIILLLILTGIALTFGAAWTVWKDILLLRREEEDVDWVLTREREGLMLVFAPAAERQGRFARGERSMRPGEPMHVETLIDDRVRRVHESSLGAGTHMPVEELRGIAETRTARFGHVARFASSLLLLLAVLGTFAGVKTALPSLIETIGAAEGGGEGSIVGPLRAVADAFGGNALALVGAIAVGLMAQGLAVGRRNLLERLELASAEYIYDNRRSTSADPLIAAVETLSATAGEVHNASTAFLGIEWSLEALGDSFRTAFSSLNDRLTDVMQQQDEMLHQRTSQALEELQSRVVALAGAVEANTRSYQGLVDRVGERAAESREAVQQMQSASEALSKALQGILQLGNASASATTRLEEGIRVLVSGTERVDQRMAAVAEAVERSRPALQEVEAAVAGAAERVSTIDARAAASWKAVADDVRKQFAEVVRQQQAPPVVVGNGSPLPSDAVGLLRRIAAAAEAPRGPSPRLIAVSAGAGVLGAGAVVYVLTRLGGWIAAAVNFVGL